MGLIYRLSAQAIALPISALGAFWAEAGGEVWTTALLSMVPTFEGRYAVVTGIAMGMPALEAYLLAFLASSLPVPIILFLLRPVLKWFYGLPISAVRKLADWVERRMLKKAASMDRGGLLGLFLFVALPIPLTGVWTGSGIAAMLKMRIRYALPVIMLGNAVACCLTTLIATGVLAGFGFLL